MALVAECPVVPPVSSPAAGGLPPVRAACPGRRPADDEPSRQALAFRAGDRAALAALYAALRPLLGSALARYCARPGGLPTSLESADLVQESWLILADLAGRWQPSGGSFAAYVRVSFPWALARYVRHHSPSRRARGVRVLGAEHPDIRKQLDRQPGVDGREWDRDLTWSELLDPLTERERAVLVLHLAEQVPIADVARALGLTRPAAYRLYRRALKRVQGARVRVGQRAVFLEARSLNLEHEGDLPRLVRALHIGAQAGGRLPGRDWLTVQTGLSQQRLARLTALLVEAGCIVDRGSRRAGRLAHPSPQATLAALGVRGMKDEG